MAEFDALATRNFIDHREVPTTSILPQATGSLEAHLVAERIQQIK